MVGCNDFDAKRRKDSCRDGVGKEPIQKCGSRWGDISIINEIYSLIFIIDAELIFIEVCDYFFFHYGLKTFNNGNAISANFLCYKRQT